MNKSQYTGRPSTFSRKEWEYFWPGFSLFSRLVVFAFLALIWGKAGGKLLVSALPGELSRFASLASTSGGRYLIAIFWTLIIAVIVRRIVKGVQAKDDVGNSYVSQNAGPTLVIESSQEAQLRLSAEMQTVSNWIGFMRFLWGAFKLSCALYLLFATPELFAALILLYCVWRGWKRWLDARRHKVWALAAQRPSEMPSSRSGQPGITTEKQSRSLVAKAERIILWVAILPVRLVVHYLVWAVAILIGVAANGSRYLKLIEAVLLYALVLPLRWIALGLQHLDIIGRFAKQTFYDLPVVIALWCISILMVSSIGFLI